MCPVARLLYAGLGGPSGGQTLPHATRQELCHTQRGCKRAELCHTSIGEAADFAMETQLHVVAVTKFEGERAMAISL